MGTSISSCIKALKTETENGYDKERDCVKALYKFTLNTELGERITYFPSPFKEKSVLDKAKQIAIEACGYIPGMVTNSVAIGKDTLLAVMFLVTTFVLAMMALFTGLQFKTLNFYAQSFSTLFVISLIALALDATGIVCPPIAYRINVYVVYDFFKTSFQKEVVSHLAQSTPRKPPTKIPSNSVLVMP